MCNKNRGSNKCRILVQKPLVNRYVGKARELAQDHVQWYALVLMVLSVSGLLLE
jgi:hypothetical protein